MIDNNVYGDIDAPPLDPVALQRGMTVQTRIFWNNSVAGSRATVKKFRTTPKGDVLVHCCYGHNLSGKPLNKWMPCNVLALAD